METKKKLGQGQYFPQLEQSGNPEIWNSYNGVTERRKIGADVLCALISNANSMKMITEHYGVIEAEKTHEIMVKTALSITDEYLRQEAE